MDVVDKIIADLVKGAARNGKAVEMHQQGHEEKLAGLGGDLGKTALFGLDDALGGVVGYNMGQAQARRGEDYSFGVPQAASLILPGGAGYQIGRGVGHNVAYHQTTDHEERKKDREEGKKDREEGKKDRKKTSALQDAFASGVEAATTRYKVAFLGALLGMGANAAGSTLAARALGSRAAGLGGQMLTNLGGQAAQAGAEHLMTPNHQQPIPYTR